MIEGRFVRKSYKTSTLTRIFTLGLKRHGVTIFSEELTIIGIIPTSILIKDINSISFELKAIAQSISYFYIITNKSGRKFLLPYSLLDGIVYQELFEDLLTLNPEIIVSEDVAEFLSSKIDKKELKFDFTVHKGSYFKKDRELTQKYPSLDAFIGFTICFFIIALPGVLGGIGDSFLTEKLGSNYPIYRIFSILTGGIAFGLAITNLFTSLVSMYLGHRLTIVLFIIAAVGLCVGFL